jgi:hypothetical protein
MVTRVRGRAMVTVEEIMMALSVTRVRRRAMVTVEEIMMALSVTRVRRAMVTVEKVMMALSVKRQAPVEDVKMSLRGSDLTATRMSDRIVIDQRPINLSSPLVSLTLIVTVTVTVISFSLSSSLFSSWC